jgi:DNA invertase Pin-like site-specific DNA recombinase
VKNRIEDSQLTIECLRCYKPREIERPKLDRLARSVPDARQIADALVARGVKLALGTSVYDPADPMGKMFFNILATFAEFEADLIRLRTREGMAMARAKGKLRGKRPKLSDKQLGGFPA